MLFFLAFAHLLTLYVAHILTRNEIEVRIHVRGLQHENVRSSFKVISVKMSQKTDQYGLRWQRRLLKKHRTIFAIYTFAIKVQLLKNTAYQTFFYLPLNTFTNSCDPCPKASKLAFNLAS